MLRSLQLKNRRGDRILDELANALSNLYSFNSEGDLDFVSTISLLLKYWNDIKTNVDKDNTECRSEFIRILNRMAVLHRETNIPVACGVRVVVCHIEFSYLNGEEARARRLHHRHPHRSRRVYCQSENCSLTCFDCWVLGRSSASASRASPRPSATKV